MGSYGISCFIEKASFLVLVSNNSFLLVFFILTLFLIVFVSTKIVPQQQAWIIEKLGRYEKTLGPGLFVIIPFLQKVAYKHTLKEKAMDINQQSAITKDNVTLVLDAVIYLRIVSPEDASYGVENPYYAVTQLAQTSMRSAIGKLVMDKTFEEREWLNNQIVTTINEAASTWGIRCIRYEIRDINPPSSILKAMETQVSSERQKRAEIMISEGKMQSIVNIAEAKKKELVLNSEAEMINNINKSKGEAIAIETVAKATSKSIDNIAQSIIKKGGTDVVSMKISQEYIEAFSKLAKVSNTVIIPAESGDVSSMVGKIATIYHKVKDISVNYKQNEK